MGSQWRPVNDQWSFGLIIMVSILQFKTAALRKIYLVCSQSKFTANRTPYLYINFRTVKCRLILHFNKWNI